MKPITVAYLGLLDSDRATGTRRAEEHLTRLAQAVAAQSGYGWTVEIMSAGREAGTQPISAGVVRTILPIAGKPRTPWDAVSWRLPEALARADLVHLHDGFSRLGEAALLIAKQSRQPVCITEYGLNGHWLSSELGLTELADVVICHCPALAGRLQSTRPVEVVPAIFDVAALGMPAAWPSTNCLPLRTPQIPRADYHAAGAGLHAIYHRLLTQTVEIAA